MPGIKFPCLVEQILTDSDNNRTFLNALVICIPRKFAKMLRSGTDKNDGIRRHQYWKL